MTQKPIVSVSKPVCLVGGAPIAQNSISAVFPFVSAFIGVDGGADHLLDAGISPAAVIGDLDSLSDKARATFADVLCAVAEQATTDFEKALTRVDAPAVLALGVTGGRIDHMLSVLNVMARHADRAVLLVDADDVSFLAPVGRCVLDLPPDSRISLMPIGRAKVSVSGVVWPFENQLMTPAGFTSPSNQVKDGVVVETDGPVLITLPQACLPQALKAAVRAE